MGINEHGIFIPHNIRLLSTYCFELISTGGSVPSLTNTSVFPINYQILLLDSYLVTVKVTFRCTAMLVFKLQREILGRFLLNKLQISLFVFVFSTGVLSHHVVIYFPLSSWWITHPHWNDISNTSKTVWIYAFLWLLLIFIYMKKMQL